MSFHLQEAELNLANISLFRAGRLLDGTGVEIEGTTSIWNLSCSQYLRVGRSSAASSGK